MQQLADGESVAWTVIAHRGHERSWWDGAGVETNTSGLGAHYDSTGTGYRVVSKRSRLAWPIVTMPIEFTEPGIPTFTQVHSMQNLVPVFSS